MILHLMKPQEKYEDITFDIARGFLLLFLFTFDSKFPAIAPLWILISQNAPRQQFLREMSVDVKENSDKYRIHTIRLYQRKPTIAKFSPE